MTRVFIDGDTVYVMSGHTGDLLKIEADTFNVELAHNLPSVAAGMVSEDESGEAAYEDGYDEGYSTGLAEGEGAAEDAYDEGYEAGKEHGYADGHSDGYDIGYEDGRASVVEEKDPAE
jgi:hypothetical protein